MNQSHPLPEAPHDLTVHTLFDMYIKYASQRLRPATIKQYNAVAKHLIRSFGTIDITSIEPHAIIQWNFKTSKKTPGMARTSISLLREVYRFASELGLVEPTKNPCFHVRRRRSPLRTRYLSEEEIKTLIQSTYHVENERIKHIQDRLPIISDPHTRVAFARIATTAIRMLVYTGCRKNEILTAKWSYVHASTNGVELHLPHTKTRPRIISLPRIGAVELSRLKKAQQASRLHSTMWIFPSPVTDKKPLQTIHKQWNLVRQHAGLLDVWLHDLRRTYASQAILAGCNFSDIAAQLGHESDRVTRRFYANTVVPPGAKTVAQKVGDRIEKIVPPHA